MAHRAEYTNPVSAERPGVRLIWIVDCESRVGHVYRADGSESVLGLGDVFDGEDVLARFSCRLGDVV